MLFLTEMFSLEGIYVKIWIPAELTPKGSYINSTGLRPGDKTQKHHVPPANNIQEHALYGTQNAGLINVVF